MRAKLARVVEPWVRSHQLVRRVLREADRRVGQAYHAAARRVPAIIQPDPRQLTVAITAYCNLRCVGCNYGRGFMQGSQLSLDTMRDVLQDAWAAGINTVRLYGGEPMIHRQLPAMIRFATDLGFRTYVTSNGTLLRQKIDELYAAGLRLITIGFYGVGPAYAAHTQRSGQFERLVRGLKYTRERYGSEIELQLNFVVMKPSCSTAALDAAWQLAVEHEMFFHLDLVSYSLPFFNNGPGTDLQFEVTDAPLISALVKRLLELQAAEPARFPHSSEFLRSIPDWLLLKAAMRVPCDAYEGLWIGADGTVQLCDAAFPLGKSTIDD